MLFLNIISYIHTNYYISSKNLELKHVTMVTDVLRNRGLVYMSTTGIYSIVTSEKLIYLVVEFFFLNKNINSQMCIKQSPTISHQTYFQNIFFF